MRIFGVILAGGQGRRMGGADKALLQLAGQSLIARVVDRLEPQVEQLAISANGDPMRFSGLGLPVLGDVNRQGPLSGILSALLWAAPRGATAVVSVPVDCPFPPPDLVPRLCLAAEASGVAMAASHGNLHPTFGLWPITLAPALAEFLASGAKERVRDFALAHGAGTADFPDDGAFANLNTPDDLARLEALIRGAE
ncbi:MAG: molybdenum cofactor guanylyltransferase MobA [Paracoccaceae bacterium]